VIAPALAEGLPPTQIASQQVMVKILESILSDELIIWILQDGDEPSIENVKALIYTAIYRDPAVKSSHLMVYSLTAFKTLELEDWTESFEELRSFAFGLGVTSMIAYSANQKIVRLCRERLGAITDFTLIEFV